MRECKGCGGEIPHIRIASALVCSTACSSRAKRIRDGDKWRALHRASKKRRYQLRHYGRILGDDPLANTKDRFRHARAEGYRSGLEVAVARQMEAANASFQYETLRIPYLVEETKHYTPDFILPNGIILEVKGRWLSPDRKKHRLIHAAFPDLDIRYIFSRPAERISKQSRTTYARFCETQGWKCAGAIVPVEWLREPKNMRSLRAIQALLGARTCD